MVVVGGSGAELDLLTVGDGGIHASLLALRRAGTGVLAADQAHPGIGRRPVLGEVVQKFHRVAAAELLGVDGGAFHCDEVGAGLGSGVAVEHHAAGVAGHAVGGKLQVAVPAVGGAEGAHRQLVAVAGGIGQHKVAARDAARHHGAFLKAPVGQHGGLCIRLGRGGQRSRTAQRHTAGQRSGSRAAQTGCECIFAHSAFLSHTKNSLCIGRRMYPFSAHTPVYPLDHLQNIA